MADIARQLQVDHILDGSVHKSANRVRITAQLIDGRSDRHLWSETTAPSTRHTKAYELYLQGSLSSWSDVDQKQALARASA